MSKGIYCGVNGVHQSKKIYSGVNGGVKQIKKAWVGIGGVPRQFYSKGVSKAPSIYLSSNRKEVAAAHNSSYAIFVGGTLAEGTVVSTSEAFNPSLVRTIISNRVRRHSAGNSLAGYAFISGGEDNEGDVLNYTDVYDSSLVSSNISSLATKRHSLKPGLLPSYALFAGGYIYGGDPSNVIDAYNSSLVRSLTYLQYSRQVSGAQVGNYCVYAGNYVNAFNDSLTRTVLTDLPHPRDDASCVNFGDYMLVGGGKTAADGHYADVDAFDTNLIRISASPLSLARSSSCAFSFGDYAVFTGGTTNVLRTETDIYDKNLVRESGQSLSIGRVRFGYGKIGNYVITSVDDVTASNVLEVFEN